MKSVYLAEWDAFIRYHVLSNDEQPTYVYLPGLICPSIPLMLQLALQPDHRNHHAILVDYLGCGFSESPETFSHSMQDHARTVAAILDAENVTNAVIIGHSMGGTVALFLAHQRPDLVSQIVMAESNIEAGGGKGTRYIASFSEETYCTDIFPTEHETLRLSGQQGNEMAAWLHGVREVSDVKAVYRASKTLVELPDNTRQLLYDLPVPCAFIYGQLTLEELNGATMPDVPDLEDMAKHGIHTHIIPDSGHIMMIDNLGGYAEAIRECVIANNQR